MQALERMLIGWRRSCAAARSLSRAWVRLLARPHTVVHSKMSWNTQCTSWPQCSNERKVGTQLRIVDLTQHLSNDMPLYPGMPRPSFVDIATVEVDGYAMSEYHLLNHIGTHVDAPSHHSIGPTLDDLPLERFVTGAVVLDFSQHERGAISGAEIALHLERIKPGDIVLIYSGGSHYWVTDTYWTGWFYPH